MSARLGIVLEIPVPYAPARPCAAPGCPELAGRGRHCLEHARAYERARGSAAARGYGIQWQMIRAAFLAARPTCECSPDCIEPATDVDHRDGSGPLGDNSWTNLQAMAHGHHSAKTVQRDGGFGRPRAREA